MAESIIMLLFSFYILNGQLKLTLDFSHEKIVDDDIICRLIEFVPDFYNFEFIMHRLFTVHQVHSVKHTDECALPTLVFRSHQITDSKH